MRDRRGWRPSFLLLLALAIGLRVALLLTYAPAHESDTAGYLNIARILHNLTLKGNDGTRPPVYPGLIALLQLNEWAVIALQAALGIGVSLLLFFITWRLTRHAGLAFALGAAYSLNLAQLYFEGMILAETLTTFLLVLVLVAMATRFGAEERLPWTELGLGVLCGLIGLTRPQMLFLGFVLPVFLWLRLRRQRLRTQVVHLSVFLVPLGLMVLGWCWINLKTAGYFGPTSIAGYSLINHAGKFMEYAPDKYAGVRDIYLKYRAVRIAETGNQAQTMWAAYFDLVAATGLNYVGLSKLLAEISLYLIVHHPVLYLRSVAEAWVGFWKVPNYWELDLVHPPALAPFLAELWRLERWVLLAANGAFLLMGPVWIYRLVGRRLQRLEAMLLGAWAVVMVGSIAQALVEYGENPRYGVPFEPVIVWVLGMAGSLVAHRWGRAAGGVGETV